MKKKDSGKTTRPKIEDYFEEAEHTSSHSDRCTKRSVPEAMRNGRSRDVAPEPTPVVIADEPARYVEFTIEGESPLLFNAPNPVTVLKIEAKQQGIAMPKDGPRNPQREFLLAAHLLAGKYELEAIPDNKYGIPSISLKKAMLVASFRQGNEKNGKSNIGSFFVHGPFEGLIEIVGPPPTMRTDVVKTKQNLLTTCYRPEFFPWKATVVIKHWNNLCTVEDLTMWLHKAGQHVGLGSRRIENSGELFGGFKILTRCEKRSDYKPTYYRRKVPQIIVNWDEADKTDDKKGTKKSKK